MADADARSLPALARVALDNALANARLEGHDIPVELQRLAAAYAAGAMDAAAFERRCREFTARLHADRQAATG